MNRLDDEVLKCAKRVVQMSRDRGQEVLDYSDDSMEVVEEMLAEAAAHAQRMSDAAVARLSQDVGCYILELARRNHGGVFRWDNARNEPAVVVSGPQLSITLFCWDKVRARLRDGAPNNVASFYASYVERVRQAQPGDRVVFL